MWLFSAVSLRSHFIPTFSQRGCPPYSRSQRHAVNATFRRLPPLHLLFSFCKLRLQSVKECLQVMHFVRCRNGDGI